MTFEEWLAKHEETCPQCGGSTDDGPPALCEEAFAKLQSSLKIRIPKPSASIEEDAR